MPNVSSYVSAHSNPSRSTEQQRRAKASTCRYQITVYFNDIEVTTTDIKSLNIDDFSVVFQHVYTIQVFQMPQSIVVKVVMRLS